MITETSGRPDTMPYLRDCCVDDVTRSARFFCLWQRRIHRKFTGELRTGCATSTSIISQCGLLKFRIWWTRILGTVVAASGVLERSPAPQHDLEGLEQNQHIEPDRGILDIEEIVLQFLRGSFHRITVAVANLSPARDPRTHQMPHAVVRNFLRKPLDKFWTFRPRPDECHVALENAPQLWNLIQP